MNLPVAPSAVENPFLSIETVELLRLVYEDLGASISVTGLDLRFRYVNRVFAKAFSLPAEKMVGMHLRDAYGETHFAALMPYVQRAVAGESINYERLGRMQATAGIWRTVSLSPWRDREGNIIGIVGASMPVHELKVSTEAARAANERVSSHMENSPLTVMELNADLTIQHCSARVLQMFDLYPETLTGKPLLAVFGQGQDQEALKLAFDRLRSGVESRNRVESTHLRADGSSVHCEWFNSALTNEQGEVTSMMALVEDISTRVHAEAHMRHVALHDQLTGLPNRSALSEALTASIARAQRTHEPLALLFIDLDGFKRVNDLYGHAAGDEVLRQVAAHLQRCVRESDVVARLGGDEFVILLNTDVQAGAPDIVCQRIFEALTPPLVFSNGSAPIGASIGIALQTPLADHADQWLKRADAAMYEAKRAGKGCVRYAAPLLEEV